MYVYWLISDCYEWEMQKRMSRVARRSTTRIDAIDESVPEQVRPALVGRQCFSTLRQLGPWGLQGIDDCNTALHPPRIQGIRGIAHLHLSRLRTTNASHGDHYVLCPDCGVRMVPLVSESVETSVQ